MDHNQRWGALSRCHVEFSRCWVVEFSEPGARTTRQREWSQTTTSQRYIQCRLRTPGALLDMSASNGHFGLNVHVMPTISGALSLVSRTTRLTDILCLRKTAAAAAAAVGDAAAGGVADILLVKQSIRRWRTFPLISSRSKDCRTTNSPVVTLMPNLPECLSFASPIDA